MTVVKWQSETKTGVRHQFDEALLVCDSSQAWSIAQVCAKSLNKLEISLLITPEKYRQRERV